MGKGGGAGKVYFVLYLAVVLELLIIIVERDEAEELLHKKQKDTMKIVESILSQLQSGSGTEGINTRPKDEITIPPADQELGVDIKPDRQYTVDVGVTDISHEVGKLMREHKPGKAVDDELERLVKKLILLSNVAEISYQVFYCEGNADDANMPAFVSDDILTTYDTSSVNGFRDLETRTPIIDENLEHTWSYLGMRNLKLDEEMTYESIKDKMVSSTLTYEDIIPMYSDSTLQYGLSCVTKDTSETRNFYFNSERKWDSLALKMTGGDDVKRRSFVVNFQPPENKGGWYKLRFKSRTNRILGVQKDPGADEAEINDKTTVNIGTVELTVKDLRKVYKELKKKVDEFGLPSLEDIDNGVLPIDQLDQSVKEAKRLDDVTDEKKGNIELYGYIVKLLSANKSQYFAQNRGDMVIDIRVIEPEMPPSMPGLNIPLVSYCFDKVKPVFEFVTLNYENNKSRVSLDILDEAGNTVTSMRYEMKEGEEPTSNQPSTVRMVAYSDEYLSEGHYKVITYHRKPGHEKVEETKLEVFASSLTSESAKSVKTRFSISTNYGSKTFFDATPTSGGKIKPNQFKIYVTPDDNPDAEAIRGLSLKPETVVVYRPPTKSVDYKIVWIQPITEKEVILAASTTPLKIALKEPRINTVGRSISFSGKTRKIRASVSNIRVTPPLTGTEKKAIVTAGEISNYKLEVSGYKFSSEPYISGNVEDGFEIEFGISGKPPTGKKKANGSITITVPFRAQHPDYPSINSTASTIITIPISYSGSR